MKTNKHQVTEKFFDQKSPEFGSRGSQTEATKGKGAPRSGDTGGNRRLPPNTLKFWLSTFIIGLLIVGGLASYLANQNTLYKGMEPLKGNTAMASVLDASEDNPPAYQIEVTNERAQAEALHALSGFMDQGSEVLKATKEKIAKSLVEPKIKVPRPETLPTATTYTAENFSCAPNDTPMIEDSQVIGCIVADPSTLYCESQGRYTYTGNEYQGIKYGMCLDCQTKEFIENGYKCS